MKAGSAIVERIRLERSVVRSVSLVAAGIGVLTAGAWLSVPFYPVPLTMQTLALLVVGGLLGPTLGVSAVAGYLALGMMGAPVFHGGLGGVALLAGPTGGYLVGFLPAVFLMGVFAKRASDRRIGLVLLGAGVLLAEVAVYAVGVPWLALFTGGGLSRAVSVGAVPFLLGDLLKAAVAVGAVRMGSPALRRRGWLPF